MLEQLLRQRVTPTRPLSVAAIDRLEAPNLVELALPPLLLGLAPLGQSFGLLGLLRQKSLAFFLQLFFGRAGLNLFGGLASILHDGIVLGALFLFVFIVILALGNVRLGNEAAPGEGARLKLRQIGRPIAAGALQDHPGFILVLNTGLGLAALLLLTRGLAGQTSELALPADLALLLEDEERRRHPVGDALAQGLLDLLGRHGLVQASEMVDDGKGRR